MAKPTYEELEQRINGLEKELDLFRDAEKSYLGMEDILQVLNLAPYGLFVIDLTGKVLAANKSGAERLGKTVQEIIGTTLREYFPPAESENRRLKGIEAIKYGKTVSFEDEVEGRWYYNTIFPISDKVGRISRLAIFGSDITDYKVVEKELRENEALLNKSQAVAHIGSWELDVIANQLTWSDEVFRMFGLRPQEFEATYEAFLDTVHPDDRTAVDAAYSDSLRERRDMYEIEHRIIRRDSGEVRTVQEKCEHIKDASGRIVRSIGIVQDITEQTRAEKALRENEARFRNLAELLPETIFETDKKGNLTYVNQKAFVHFMYTQEDFERGLNAFDMIVPEDHHRAMENFQKIVKGESLGLTEYTALRKDGSTFPAIFHSTPIMREGKPAGLRGFIIDISERKRAEEMLKEREEFLQNIFNAIQDGISVLDLELNIIRVNPWMEKMYARQAPLAGKKCYSAYQERDTPCPWCPTLKSIETGKTHSTVVPYPSEEKLIGWIDLSAFPLKDGEGNVVGIIEYVKDITEQKKAEEALIESEKKYRLLVENAEDAVFIAQDGLIKFANPATLSILGYSERRIEETGEIPFPNHIHPEEREAILDRHLRRLEGEEVPGSYSFRLVRKGGDVIWGDINVVLITWEGRPATLNFLRDKTHQKRLEEQLQQAQRMEAIGTLAGGIAHDFNNLLMGIQGNTSLMLLDRESKHPDYEKLKNIEQYVRNGADLTKQLLGFARGGRYHLRPVDLNELIERGSRMFGRTRKEIQIHTKYQKDLWVVEVDQVQIEQVLLNLYVNAWQAMPAGGELYVGTENLHLSKDFVRPFRSRPGRYVRISIKDTGVGMDEETRKRVFDPFFTTKEMMRGTGLGLASVYGIVRNHEGIIEVYSKQGEGTTFHIYLPASDKEVIDEKNTSTDILKGEGTVLLVDDEEMIIDVGKELLKKLGYKVMTAKSGKEAIDLYKKNMADIDLVILDMIMPAMSGGETYDILKKINPDIKVLLASGYSINGQAQKILDRGCNAFIQKPFNMKQLSIELQELLDEK